MVFRVGVGGEGDDRQVSPPGFLLAYSACGCESVQSWHLHVHQHQVVARLFQRIQCFLAILRQRDAVALAFRQA